MAALMNIMEESAVFHKRGLVFANALYATVLFCITSSAFGQNGTANALSTTNPVQPYVPHLEFDVVAIHPSANEPMSYIDNTPGTSLYISKSVPVRGLLLRAYGIQINDQLENAPSWTMTTRYDVEAKSDASADQYLAKLSHDDFIAEKRHMLQLLLADRFHLQIHSEKRIATTYALITTNRTLMLMTPVKGEVYKTVSSCDIRYVEKGEEIRSIGCPFPLLLSKLKQALGTDIVDHTGMTGMFAYHLMWNSEGGTLPNGEEQYPLMIDAVREQLGLELKRTKAPVTFWVVDHIERPTPN